MLVWLGMPCTTFSKARKNDGLGPGPLRDSGNLWGLPSLSWKDFCKVREGNHLFRFTLKILQLCNQHSIPFVLENPLSSFAWSMPPLLQFMHESESMICDLDFCMYGEQWKKPTRLLYKYLGISCLSRRCISNNNTCERTSRPHIPLQGRDAEGVFLTLRAQPYPWALANDFANVVARAFS